MVIFFLLFSLQFVIIVIDSTDRERLAVIKEEIYRMLADEVSTTFFFLYISYIYIHVQGVVKKNEPPKETRCK